MIPAQQLWPSTTHVGDMTAELVITYHQYHLPPAPVTRDLCHVVTSSAGYMIHFILHFPPAHKKNFLSPSLSILAKSKEYCKINKTSELLSVFHIYVNMSTEYRSQTIFIYYLFILPLMIIFLSHRKLVT